MRHKLLILILAVLLPFLVFNLWQTNERYTQATNRELEASEELASAVAIAFQNYLDKIWDTEYVLGQAVFLQNKPLSPVLTQSLLTRQLKAQPTIRHMALVDPNGKIVVAAPVEAQSTSICDRDHFRRILAGSDMVVSDLMVSRITKQTTFIISRAIRDEQGNLLGAINAGVDRSQLANVLLPIKAHGSYKIVDSTGNVVFRSNYGEHPDEQRELATDDPALLALKQQSTVKATRYIESSSGKEKMGVAVYLPKIGWTTSFVAPVDMVFTDAMRESQRDMLIVVLSGLVALSIGFLISNSLLHPIYALQRTAEALSKGDLSARTGLLDGTDELAATARAFDHMASQIEELDTIRTKMMQTAAHELRNPIAGAKGVLALIRRRIESNRPAEQVNQLVVIAEREMDRVTKVLDEFVDAFRIQNGRSEVVKEPLDFNAVIEEALAPFEARFSDSAIQYRFTVETDASPSYHVCGDYRRLVQVVHNLISNAVKYSADGGDITLTLKQEDSYILFTVKDHGMGIPPADLPYIFDSFYRASNVKVGGPGGVGLGLFICKDIVEQHGGTIWAESKTGEGSMFYIQLPCSLHTDSLSNQKHTMIEAV